MLTRDGKQVDWPYSDAPMTTLTAGELAKLRSEDACEKCVAHARLNPVQMTILYRKRGFIYAKQLRWVGSWIVRHRLEPYAAGLSLYAIRKVIGSSRDRTVLVEKLLKHGA